MIDCDVLMKFLQETQEDLEKIFDGIPNSFVSSVEVLFNPKDEPNKKHYIFSQFLPKEKKRGRHRISKRKRKIINQQIDELIEKRYKNLSELIDKDKYHVGLTSTYSLANKKECSGVSCEYHSNKAGWYYKRYYRCRGRCCSRWTKEECS